MIKDIVEILKRWDVWRRVEATPDRVDALEKRMAAMEQHLQRSAGDACPSCHARDFRLTKSVPSKTPFGDLGVRDQHWLCSGCGFEDVRLSG